MPTHRPGGNRPGRDASGSQRWNCRDPKRGPCPSRREWSEIQPILKQAPRSSRSLSSSGSNDGSVEAAIGPSPSETKDLSSLDKSCPRIGGIWTQDHREARG